jgi:hypothetical protein
VDNINYTVNKQTQPPKLKHVANNHISNEQTMWKAINFKHLKTQPSRPPNGVKQYQKMHLTP